MSMPAAPTAMLEDPTAPPIYRVSGEASYNQPGEHLPASIYPRQVTLRDRITTATLLPFKGLTDHVPKSLLLYLSEQLNREIEIGDTYPMLDPLSLDQFVNYWFQGFTAIMVIGDHESLGALLEMERKRADWSKLCLGSFWIKPNYAGRSSHVCHGAFLVTDAARNKGVGRLMGEGYLDWAPRLGYTYSVFNLVYETNVASCRIWDALGFKRIGRVKGAGSLRSHPDELIDAIIYGRDLGPEGEDFVSEERFDKIRYYLKHSKYPAGADRAEKSRLRSAATHYKLLPNPDGGEERLMLKDKEVVADPQRQYEIARQLHTQTHGGINKTTASIAERYHWVRIKETVSLVIKNCTECKESSKNQGPRLDGQINPAPGPGRKSQSSSNMNTSHDPNREIERLVNLDHTHSAPANMQTLNENINPRRPRRSLPTKQEPDMDIESQHEVLSQQALQQQTMQQHPLAQHQAPVAQMHQLHYGEMPLDPHLMHSNFPGLTSEAMARALDRNLATHQGLASDHPMSHQSLGNNHTLSHQGLTNDHNLTPHQSLTNDRTMPSHQSLTNDHGLAAHQNLNNIGLAHGLPAPSGIQGHHVDHQNMNAVDQHMHSVNQNMHPADQNIAHTLDQHNNIMRVDMNVMGHSGFGMGLGPPGPGHPQGMNVGLGPDDRMDTDNDENGEAQLGHHLMEAGFGGGHAVS